MSATEAEIWLLLDDRAGNRSQCLGVAEHLTRPYSAKEITYNFLAALPNGVLGASFVGISKKSRAALHAPWPELVIAAGRRTAPVAREIKRRSGGRTKLVQLMWPGRAGADAFDLIVAPYHDEIAKRENLLEVHGAPNAVTLERLADTKAKHEAEFRDLPKPKIGLLCGGSTKNRRFTRSMAIELGQMASALARQSGGSLMVTTSRRTGEQATPLIEQIDAPSHIHRWNDPGENPYFAYLASADALIVTGESMSMCSEACSTGKPVYIYAPADLISEKHHRLHQELYAQGCARPLGDVHEPWHYKPLEVASRVARHALDLIEPPAGAPNSGR